MNRNLHDYWGPKRIIPAVRKTADLQTACNSEWPVVFLLIGDLFTVEEYVSQVLRARKKVFLHVDFINGLGSDPIVIKFIAERIKPTGIISTKSHFVKQAKKSGLIAIQRMFLIDNSALDQGIQNIEQSCPDAVEIMPGLIPRVITKLRDTLPQPIIAGGLIQDHAEIEIALQAGASAVSMGSKHLWAPRS
ncbi:glycerol-3-phosphate responsive antiterminator [Cohnella herbarum]|jgi:glycerol uptake operon antiterminator|uniref:Glycerol uptake operon antiterminator regulatory protein n=1 Tax=Cohnella herbarum TaxID=2728023 RepID=A0A7Z2VLG4_9BACL|nr:glycerol-3-phosphate responsive antiterminator [Cohnella herbarum]QJD84975.1 glycerol-3-phosphate responsive antiterminator [Cohnella herbarum]